MNCYPLYVTMTHYCTEIKSNIQEQDLLSLVGRVFFSSVLTVFNFPLSKVVTPETSGLVSAIEHSI